MSELNLTALKSAERIRVVSGKGYFPVIVKTADRALLAVFRDGAGHMGREGFLVSSRSTDGGRTWSEPVIVVKTREYDDRNPAVGVAKDGRVTVAYHANSMYGPDGKYMKDRRDPTALHTGLVHSTDDGRTWAQPMLWTDATEWDSMSPYGRILTLDDGTMAMPIYLEKSYLLRSKDGGRSWGDLTFVADDINEAAYCVLPSREWLVMGRKEREDEEHRMLLRRSSDGGRTWSELTPFGRGRTLPADLALLSDGSVLVVYGYRDRPFGARARRSRDGGRTWSERELILHDRAESSDCGYPSAVLTDGWVVVAFYDAGRCTTYDGSNAFCEVVRIREEELIEALV